MCLFVVVVVNAAYKVLELNEPCRRFPERESTARN